MATCLCRWTSCASPLSPTRRHVITLPTPTPHAHPLPPHRVRCGYTQLFREAMDELPQPPTHVLVQAGVGGLLAAGAAYMSVRSPTTRVVSVEPVDAGCILENMKVTILTFSRPHLP